MKRSYGIVLFHILFYCASSLFSLFQNNSFAVEPEKYIWPIEIDGYITGNFGECRWDHFHAGLDIGTDGINGYKLFAIADGYVYRVRASATGYGKALYLKLNDGRHVVYAHMNDFSDDIKRYITAEQKKQGKYEINLYPSEDMFPVKQGDVIGYSGNSGDVAPHLHIELRDENEAPLNILTHGLKLKKTDTTAPALRNLAVKPFTPYSMVDQHFEQMIYPAEKVNDSTYRISAPIETWGQVGLKVDAFDTERNGQYILAVHTLKMFVDDRLLYTISMDSFSYGDEYHNNFFMYDRELKYTIADPLKGEYMRLFSLPGIALPMTSQAPGSGFLFCGAEEMRGEINFLTAGDHAVRIEATDANGNTSKLICTLRVSYPDIMSKAYTVARPATASALVLEPYITFYESFFTVTVRTSESPAEMPSVKINASDSTLPVLSTLVHSNNHFEYIFEPVTGKQCDYVMSVSARAADESVVKHESVFSVASIGTQGGTFVSADGEFSLSVKSNNRGFIPYVEVADIDKSAMKLPVLSTIYQFNPRGYELSSPAEITVKLNQPVPKNSVFAVFEWMGDYWRLLSTTPSPDNITATARIGHLSTFAVLADSEPPRIEFVTPSQKMPFVKMGTTVVCRVMDDGVGLSYTKLMMMVDNSSVPAEYRYTNNEFVYTLDDVPAGNHVLRIYAEDRLSNEIIQEMKFTVTQE
jgi:hypothetical protein